MEKIVRTIRDFHLPPISVGDTIPIRVEMPGQTLFINLKVQRVEISDSYIHIHTEPAQDEVDGGAWFKDLRYDFTEEDKKQQTITPKWTTTQLSAMNCKVDLRPE